MSWLFNNEPIVSPDYQISSFGDNHSLFIPEVFDEDAGRFSVAAENEAGKATCSALLVVVDASAAPPQVPSPPYVARVSGAFWWVVDNVVANLDLGSHFSSHEDGLLV